MHGHVLHVEREHLGSHYAHKPLLGAGLEGGPYLAGFARTRRREHQCRGLRGQAGPCPAPRSPPSSPLLRAHVAHAARVAQGLGACSAGKGTVTLTPCCCVAAAPAQYMDLHAVPEHSSTVAVLSSSTC